MKKKPMTCAEAGCKGGKSRSKAKLKALAVARAKRWAKK